MTTFGSGLGVGGLASGLDTNAIVAKLVQIESLPIQQFGAKKNAHKNKLDGISQLKQLVKALETKSQAISTTSNFLSFKSKVSQEGVASVTATGSASAAAHTLTVEQLAAVDRWAFDGIADASVNLTAATGQTVSFTVNGTNHSIAVDPASSSLTNIAAEINDQAGEDVTASVVNTGTASSPSFKLVITSKTSGEDARITSIASTVTGLVIDGTGPDVNGDPVSVNNITVGTNAVAIVDGLTVERSTNDFTDVITGISFTVLAEDPATQITFSAEPDKTAIKGKVQEFVDAYNAVIQFMNTQNTYTEEDGPGGVLFGDSLLSSTRSSMQKALSDVALDDVINDTAGYSTLSAIGITTGRDGTLSIDQTKLEDKLSVDLQAFANLFVDTDGFDNGGAAVNTPEYFTDTTEDSGLAANLVRSIDRLLTSAEGAGGTTLKSVFEARTETLTKQLRALDDQITRKQEAVDRYEATLIERFARLESLIGQLNRQGQGFAAAISGLT